MTRASARPAANSSARGVLWGLLAAAIWASYTVLARLAVKAGLSPGDLTLLRFAPGALPMAPSMCRWGLRDLAGHGWRRGLLLAFGATQLWVQRGASDHDQALGPREGTAGRARLR